MIRVQYSLDITGEFFVYRPKSPLPPFAKGGGKWKMSPFVEGEKMIGDIKNSLTITDIFLYNVSNPPYPPLLKGGTSFISPFSKVPLTGCAKG